MGTRPDARQRSLRDHANDMTMSGVSPSRSAAAGLWAEPQHLIDTRSIDTTTFNMSRHSLGYDLTHGDDDIWQIESPPKRYVSLAEHDLYDEVAQLDDEGRFISVADPSPPRPHASSLRSPSRSPLKHTSGNNVTASPHRMALQQAARAAAISSPVSSSQQRNAREGKSAASPRGTQPNQLIRDATADVIPTLPAPKLISDGRIRLHHWYVGFQRTKSAPSFSPDAYDLTHWIQVTGVRFRSEEQKGATGRDEMEAGENWHSSLIAERVSRNLVKTSSGKLYELVGTCDEVAMRERKGFSDVAIRDFNAGFPARWLTCVVSEARQRGLVQKVAGQSPAVASPTKDGRLSVRKAIKSSRQTEEAEPRESDAGPSTKSALPEKERAIRSGKQLPGQKQSTTSGKQLPQSQRPTLSGKQMPKARPEPPRRKRKTESESDSDYVPEQKASEPKDQSQTSQSEASDAESDQPTPRKKRGRPSAKASLPQKKRGRPKGRRNALSESESASDSEWDEEEPQSKKRQKSGAASVTRPGRRSTAKPTAQRKRAARQRSSSFSDSESLDGEEEHTTPRHSAKVKQRRLQRRDSSDSDFEDDATHAGSIQSSRQAAFKSQKAGSTRHSIGGVSSHSLPPKKVSRELLSLSKTAFGRLVTVENAIMEGLEDLRSSRKAARHSLPAHLSHRGPRTPVNRTSQQRIATPRSSSRKRTSASKWWEVQPSPAPTLERQKSASHAGRAPRSSVSIMSDQRRGESDDEGEEGDSELGEEETHVTEKRKGDSMKNVAKVTARSTKEGRVSRRSNESSESDEDGDIELANGQGDDADEDDVEAEASKDDLEQALFAAVWDQEDEVDDQEAGSDEEEEREVESLADVAEATAMNVKGDIALHAASPLRTTTLTELMVAGAEEAKKRSESALKPAKERARTAMEIMDDVVDLCSPSPSPEPQDVIALDQSPRRATPIAEQEEAPDVYQYGRNSTPSPAQKEDAGLNERHTSAMPAAELQVIDLEQDTRSPTPLPEQKDAVALDQSPRRATPIAEQEKAPDVYQNGRNPTPSPAQKEDADLVERPTNATPAAALEVIDLEPDVCSPTPLPEQNDAIAVDQSAQSAPPTAEQQEEEVQVDQPAHVPPMQGDAIALDESTRGATLVADQTEVIDVDLHARSPTPPPTKAALPHERARSATPAVQQFFESLEQPQSPLPLPEDAQPSPLLDVDLVRSSDGRLLKVYNAKDDAMDGDDIFADEDDNDSEDSLSDDDESSASPYEPYYFSD